MKGFSKALLPDTQGSLSQSVTYKLPPRDRKRELVKEKNQSGKELCKLARSTIHFTDKETEARKGYVTCMKITHHWTRGSLNLSPRLFSLQLVSLVHKESTEPAGETELFSM